MPSLGLVASSWVVAILQPQQLLLCNVSVSTSSDPQQHEAVVMAAAKWPQLSGQGADRYSCP